MENYGNSVNTEQLRTQVQSRSDGSFEQGKNLELMTEGEEDWALGEEGCKYCD